MPTLNELLIAEATDLDGATNQVTIQVNNQDKRIESLLKFCSVERTREEIQPLWDNEQRIFPQSNFKTIA